MTIILRVAVAMAAVCVCSCMQVPRNTGAANVRFDEVVKRLKCDLIRAVKRKVNEDPRYTFLTQWAAKVHMTLSVDDTASVNPGLTVIDPLAVVGTSFSLGVGGTFGGQAVRSEDYEFFLLFSNVAKEMHSSPVFAEVYDDCRFPPGLLLESNLDLDSVLDRALSPVGAGTLHTGPQVGPGSSAAAAIPANEARNIREALKNLGGIPDVQMTPQVLIRNATSLSQQRFNNIFESIQQEKNITILGQNEKEKQDAKDKKKNELATALANATKVEQDTQLIITTVVNPLYELATSTSMAPKCLSEMLRHRIQAVARAANVSILKVRIDDADPEKPDEILKYFEDEKKAKQDALLSAQTMLDSIDKCHVAPPKPAVAREPLYDPIDLIQQTVNFYITASGSITPSWKLVRISAPLNSPLLSGTAKATDTLIITMGRPDSKDGKPVASGPMNTSLQASLISQAINQRLVP